MINHDSLYYIFLELTWDYGTFCAYNGNHENVGEEVHNDVVPG